MTIPDATQIFEVKKVNFRDSFTQSQTLLVQGPVATATMPPRNVNGEPASHELRPRLLRNFHTGVQVKQLEDNLRAFLEAEFCPNNTLGAKLKIPCTPPFFGE
jgi:hypothetical protein